MATTPQNGDMGYGTAPAATGAGWRRLGQRPLSTQLIAFAVVVACLVIAPVVMLFSALDDAGAAKMRAQRAGQTMWGITGVERLLSAIETGAQRYIITSEPRSLAALSEARAALPVAARDLVDLAGDNAQRRQAARSIEDAVLLYTDLLSPREIDRARADPSAARRLVTAPQARRARSVIEQRIGLLVGLMVAEFGATTTEEGSAARRAQLWSAGLAGVTLLALALLVLYLARAVGRPLRGIGRATAAIAGGDLSVRVPATGAGEVRGLSETFNHMIARIEEARSDLKSERDALESLSRLEAGLLSDDTLGGRADSALREACRMCAADAGMLHVRLRPTEQDLGLVAVVGLDRDALPQWLSPSEGPGAMAVAERRIVARTRDQGALVVRSFGERISLRHELHVPLFAGDDLVGVLSLARAGEPFDEAVIGRLAASADQIAVALMSALGQAWAREQAAITRVVVDAMPEGLQLVAADGTVLLANPAMARLLEDLDLPNGDLVSGGGALADRTIDPEAFRTALATLARSPGHPHRFEFEILDDGRTFDWRSMGLRGHDGTDAGKLLILGETTTQRTAERLTDDLLAIVSHELRTPLTSLAGFIDLLASESDLEAGERRRYLDIAKHATIQLQGIVADLLLLSQSRAAQLALDFEPVDLAGLVEERVRIAEREALVRGIDLTVVADPWTSLVVADRRRVAQIVDNLLSNAVKFTLDGGSVRIDVAVRDATALLTVSDTGIGIPAAELPHLFQWFYRGTAALNRQIPGSGLGLLIARTIARAHGGDITIRSTEGEGTSVTVELPLAPPGAAPRAGQGERSATGRGGR